MEDGQFLFNIWNKPKKDDESIELTKDLPDDDDMKNNNNNKDLDTGFINTYLTKLPNFIFGTDEDETPLNDNDKPPDSPIDEKDESMKADDEVAGIMDQSEDSIEGEEEPGVIDKYIRPLWPFGGDEKPTEAEEAEEEAQPDNDVAETESMDDDSVLINMKAPVEEDRSVQPQGEEELPAYMVEDELAVQENQAPDQDFPEYATISTVRDNTDLSNGEPEAIAAMEAAVATPTETPSVSEMAIYSTKSGEGEVELVPPKKPARELKKKRKDRCKAFWIPLLCFLLAAGIVVFLLWFSGLFDRKPKATLVPSKAPLFGCKSGWTYYSGSCYYFSGHEKNWTAAVAHCKTKCKQSHLLVINDPYEQDFLVDQYNMKDGHRYFWIGCQDMDEDRTWNCEDNSGMRFTENGGGQYGFWDWNPREPTFGERNEFCIEYRENGWNDHPCAAYNHFICEYKLSPETVTPAVTTSSPPAPEVIIQTPLVEYILLDLTLYLDGQYAPEYYNPMSQEYQDLKEDITMALDELFLNNVGNLYNDSNVSLISFNSTNNNTKVEVNLSLNDAPQIIGTEDDTNRNEDEVVDLIKEVTADLIKDVFTNSSSRETLDSIGYIDGSVDIDEPIVVFTPTTTQINLTTKLSTTTMPSTTSQLSTKQLTTEHLTTAQPTTEQPSTADKTAVLQTTAVLTSELSTKGSITTPQQTTQQVITTEVQSTTNLQTIRMTTEYPCEPWDPATAVNCNLPYADTYFPNFITNNATNYKNIKIAEFQLRQLWRHKDCHVNALNFFCGVIFPGCPVAPGGQITVCKGFCEEVAKDQRCLEGFVGIGLDLQDICKILPDVPIDESGNFCTF